MDSVNNISIVHICYILLLQVVDSETHRDGSGRRTAFGVFSRGLLGVLASRCGRESGWVEVDREMMMRRGT